MYASRYVLILTKKTCKYVAVYEAQALNKGVLNNHLVDDHTKP